MLAFLSYMVQYISVILNDYEILSKSISVNLISYLSGKFCKNYRKSYIRQSYILKIEEVFCNQQVEVSPRYFQVGICMDALG
jgi:hypothetical protein